MIIPKGYKEVSNIIKGGGGFINPIAEQADAAKEQALALNVGSLISKAEDIATKLNITNPSQFAASISSLSVKSSNAVAAINNFKGHIDQLSGVVLNGEKNLITLLELAKAAQETIVECSSNPDDENSYKNNPMYKLFGSVLNAGKHNQRFEKAVQRVKDINDFFSIDELSDYLQGRPETEQVKEINKKIDEMKAIYDDIKGKLETAQQEDDDAYTALQSDVLAQVATTMIASLVGDRCANQVISKVKSPALHKAIQLAKKI